MTARLLHPRAERVVREGFADLLAVDRGVESHLGGVIEQTLAHPGSLVRSQLAYGLMRGHGVCQAPARALAVALEYFHTASLLFDDLPAMDDARERRGHPCPHHIYGAGATILGALALVNRAYTLLWQVLGRLPVARQRRATELVDTCLGVRGILDGQARDLHHRAGTAGVDGDEAMRVAEGKTVTLIRLTLLLPALVAGAPASARHQLDRLAQVWGHAYQLLDDVKDVVSSPDEAGKTTGRDGALGRPNLFAAAGRGATRVRLEALLAEGRARVGSLRGARWATLSRVQNLLEGEWLRLLGRLDRVGARPAIAAPTSRPRGRSTHPLRFAEQALSLTLGPRDTLVVRVLAPVAAAEALLEASGRQPSCFWDPGDGTAWAGLGVARALGAVGKDRFTHLRTRAARIAPRIATRTAANVAAELPRWFGGLAFAARAADEAPWSAFGDASFVLPRLLYRTGADHASLGLAVRGDELGNRALRARWLDLLAGTLAGLDAYTAQPDAAIRQGTEVGVQMLESPSLQAWTTLVEAITRGIEDGRFAKIVAARRSRLALLAPLTTPDVLRRLSPSPGVTRFAFGRSRSVFLGATPERLVARHGLSFATEALAGTAKRGDADSLRALTGSKIRREHAIVVDEIARRLTPLAASLAAAAAAERRALRDVVHLRTAIRGQLARPRHILDLAARLHPTPAVGGVPRADALAWIAAHERAPRGWYAAPVGWFDTAGDGEFKVALRCAVLRSAEAYLYAGSGIVTGSDPLAEHRETALKERTLLRALAG